MPLHRRLRPFNPPPHPPLCPQVALKICAGKVIKASSQSADKTLLDETNFQVGALVSAVERVIFHGAVLPDLNCLRIVTFLMCVSQE